VAVLRPDTLGSLQRSPDPLAGLKREGKEEREEGWGRNEEPVRIPNV